MPSRLDKTGSAWPRDRVLSLLQSLSGEASEILGEAKAIACDLEVELYLVGGTVRDLILGLEPRDLDLLVNAKGRDLAERLAERVGGRLEYHPEFFTADIRRPSGLPIDVATMRAEEYPVPGGLPLTRSGSLSEDLSRRDFTVNALAIRLRPADNLGLIDECDGVGDLDRRRLKVLHANSFFEDPTRVIRGVRLARDLGFALEPETRTLALKAADEGAFDPLSGDRLWHELELLWRDLASSAASIRRLKELHLLSTFLPPTVEADGVEADLGELFTVSQSNSSLGALVARARTPWVVLALLLVGLSAEQMAKTESRLALVGRRQNIVMESERIRSISLLISSEDVAPHRVFEVLRQVSDSGLVVQWVTSGDRGRRWIEWYVETGLEFRLLIRGSDLIASGVEEGPLIGRALNETLRARLDGELEASRELDFALAIVRELAGSQGGEGSDA